MSKPTQKDLIPGTITPNGVVLETHEMATVVFLTEMGYDIELIPKSNIKGIHTPDIRMSGREWEMKSPKGRPTAEQKDFVSLLNKGGYKAVFCYGWESARETIETYLSEAESALKTQM